MTVPRRWPAPGSRWPVLTRAGRARVRDQRLTDLRSFAQHAGWDVLGLHQDLSVRHPVAPLVGAVSAQAELAVAGVWEHWSAMVASVLVRMPEDRATPRRRDAVVQLTTLDTGPLRNQFTATVTSGGVELALLGRAQPDAAARITGLLADASEAGRLRVGDHVAADEVELLHTRLLGDSRERVDLDGPLRALAALADLLLER